MSRYLSEILLIQIVATVLVILGHSYPFTIVLPQWLVNTQIFIYAFHMPLFVWISGYLLVYTDQSMRMSMCGFIKKRFFKLIIPYLILSVFALVPKYFVQDYLNDSITLTLEAIVRVFLVPRENVWGHFWFLPMIFIMGTTGFVIDRIFIKTIGRRLGWLIITIFAFIAYIFVQKEKITPWLSIDDLMTFGWVFALGASSATFRLISKLPKKNIVLQSVIALLIATIIYSIHFNETISILKGPLIAIVMIYSLVQLCIAVSKKINLSQNAVYAQTFTIFILSWPCQAVVNIILERILNMPYSAIMLGQFIAGVVGPIILILLINRFEQKNNTHFISFILGK